MVMCFRIHLKSNMKMGSMKNALSNTTVREMPFSDCERGGDKQCVPRVRKTDA